MGVHFISWENVVHWSKKKISSVNGNHENCIWAVTLIKLQCLEYPEDDPPLHISKIGRVFFYIANYSYKWKGSVPL